MHDGGTGDEVSVRRILVVDDDRVLRDVVRAVLDSTGGEVRVDEAGTVHSGTDMAQAGRPDVILLDERLPDGSGMAAVPILRRLCPTALIIIHTGADVAPEEAIAAGADDVLRKGDDLVAAVEARLFGGREPAGSR